MSRGHNLTYLYVDIDECTAGTDNCDDNASCGNTVGGFTCTCNTGYTGSGVSCSGNFIDTYLTILCGPLLTTLTKIPLFFLKSMVNDKFH